MQTLKPFFASFGKDLAPAVNSTKSRPEAAQKRAERRHK